MSNHKIARKNSTLLPAIFPEWYPFSMVLLIFAMVFVVVKVMNRRAAQKIDDMTGQLM